MCGIFGVMTKEGVFSNSELRRISDDLFRLSESRGKESAGLAVLTSDTVQIYKQSVSASTMIRNRAYKSVFEKTTKNSTPNGYAPIPSPVTVIGHSRLVTNGSQEIHHNNQPVIKEGLIGIHNGIIVNDDDLWQEFPMLQRHYQVDTEVILSLTRHFYVQTNSLVQALRAAFQLVEGTVSIATLFNDINVLALATNNGSLYTCPSHQGDIHIFASEAYILQQLLRRRYLQQMFDQTEIRQIAPDSGCIIDLVNLNKEPFALTGTDELHHLTLSNGSSRSIVEVNAKDKLTTTTVSNPTAPIIIPESIPKRFAIDERPIMALRRCTKCLLPETIPFIEFDNQGVCNYCRNYQKYTPLGEEALQEVVERYRNKDGKPDCLVTFSGGRDSSYCLHYVKNILKMHPVAYTFDWGMVTDLARRNQARLCGQLGIEHILVSADIHKKRENIRKNITAWLKRPHLGTIPLFMAGDKQYFFYANKLRQQTGVDLIFHAKNPMEKTDFKDGFCGVPPSFTQIPWLRRGTKQLGFYGKEYLLNPAYLNTSVLDTVWAFLSYYIIPHNYLRPFEYLRWNEEEINSTLRQQYDWEIANDTQTTWRIGDGTAAFYNYIYYTVAGFTENDTFRSNQIREGLLSREQALDIITNENQPRFETIQWYCDIVGIDMVTTLERINSIPKLYPT